MEPAHSDEKIDKLAFTNSSNKVTLVQHDFALEYKKQPDGKLEISYQLPNDTENVFVGLWNQFAFYVKTLVHDKVQAQGRQTILWDGLDDDGKPLGKGVYICRLSADGRQGGSQMVRLD